MLSPQGLCYLVVEQCNKPEILMEQIKSKRFNCDVVIERRAGREFLKILRISRI